MLNYWIAFDPIDPLQMIVSFLTAIETPLKAIATLLAVIVVIIVIIKAITAAQMGGLNVWSLVLSLIGITLLWFIVFNIRDIMCWIITSMGKSCPV